MAFHIPIGIGMLWSGLKVMLAGLVAWIIANLGAIIAQVMLSLGLYFFVAEPAADFIGSEIQDAFGGVSAAVLETLYYLNVDDYLAMVTSAFTSRKAWDAGKSLKIGKTASSTGA